MSLGPGATMTLTSEYIVLQWVVTNIGTRPLKIHGIGVKPGDWPSKMPLPQTVYRMLAPDDKETFETSLKKVDVPNVNALTVWDTRGRMYDAPFEDVEALRSTGIS